MLATLVAVRKDRDAKADPATAGRRNQACELLADTGIRVARNYWSAGLRPAATSAGVVGEPTAMFRQLNLL